MNKNNVHESLFLNKTGINFQKFYKEYKSRLSWYLSRFTKSFDIAEDWADEAFVQALLKIDTYNPDKGAQIHTWLYTIAENLVKNDYKIQQRLPSLSLDKEISDNFRLINCISYNDGEREMQGNVELEAKAKIIKSTIHGLPDKYRRVLVMRELENMSYKHISDDLGINLSTVKSQIKKGRKLVRQKVQSRFKSIEENGVS